MAWYHTAREDKLAPIGLYEPKRYTITVYDSFDHFRLDTAARVLHLEGVPSFLFYAANYVLRNDRRLRRMRTMLRKGARQIQAAKRLPTPPRSLGADPDLLRDSRHREAMERFYEAVEAELVNLRGVGRQ